MGMAGDYAKERQLGMMNAAQARVDGLRASVAATKIELAELEKASGLGKLEKDAEAAGQSMKSLEGLAMRMIERMAILYAFRESFALVKDIYDGAAALEALNNRTDISFGKLQQLEQLGDEVGISFKDTAGWVEKFSKNLEQFKGGDELKELGLSFKQLFEMNPDDRINAIAGALSQVESKAERGRIEVALFGSDAIDPLIPLLARFGDQIDRSNQMSDGTIRVLAEARRSYGEAGEVIKAMTGHLLELGIKGSEFVLSPFVIFFEAGFPGLKTAAANSDLFNNKLAATLALISGGPQGLLEFAVGLDHIADAAGKADKGLTVLPVEGQAFIDSLRASIPLTREQRDALDQLNSMHELTIQNAVKATAENQVSTAQYKAYVAELAEAKHALTEHNAELAKSAREYEHAEKVVREVLDAQSDWRGTLATINPELRAHVIELARAGVAVATLGEFYGLSKTQMSAVTDEIREQDHQAKILILTTELLEKVQAKYHQVVTDMGATHLQKQIAANEDAYQNAVATAQKKGVVDEKYYHDLKMLRDANNASDVQALASSSHQSREYYALQLAQAKEYYYTLLADASNHTEQEIELARKEYEEKQKLLNNWVRTMKTGQSDSNAATAAFMRNFSVMALHAEDDLSDMKIKVQLVTGEIVTLQQALDRYNRAAGIIDYDLSTQGGIDFYRKMNPGAQITLSDAQIIAMTSAGATLQMLIERGFIDPYAGIRGSLHQTRVTPMTSGTEGFDVSRTATGATALTSASALVTPASLVSMVTDAVITSGGHAVTNNFYVNGTGEEIYEFIRVRLMRDAKSQRMWGTT